MRIKNNFIEKGYIFIKIARCEEQKSFETSEKEVFDQEILEEIIVELRDLANLILMLKINISHGWSEEKGSIF